ncbi:uncharacterized protein LOC128207981 [Mya arenaria]|uniref:uncharacterized protein LOC128207981 n=2 Tax=Mya arenaria TaxID=6604 RepID=UPI0022DEFDA4|nr:uncharacterized protein LOC128207981 [Mya arenaria]XP_052767187.1 uncharacterized protein LOC128207981 [Mya arenaria]
MGQHLRQHGREEECKWAQCNGFQRTSYEDLELHIIHDHFFDDRITFPSLDDWLEYLPEKRIDPETTDLRFCPKHLRSKLKLLLFDEDYLDMPTNKSYTMSDHLCTLDFESNHYTKNFLNIEKKFIEKRLLLGEDWSDYNGKFEENDTDSLLSPDPKVRKHRQFHGGKYQFHFVQTSRPELSSNSHSGTKLKPVKRKASCTFPNEWSSILLTNLRFCSHAITMQNLFLNLILDEGIVDCKKLSFLKLEYDTALLASAKTCTKGVFVCHVFKIIVDNAEYLYIRYVESGVYAGLMEQKYLQEIKDTFHYTDNNMFLHNTLTVEDIQNMESDHIKDKKEKPNTYKPSSRLNDFFKQKFIPGIADTRQMKDTDNINCLSFAVSILPFSSTSTAKFMDACTAGKEDRLQALLLDFRHSKLEQVPRNSREIFQQQYEGEETLLSQSKALNCLPGDVKRKTELFKGDPKFASNFINKKKPQLRTSLRYLTFSLFLQNEINTIFTKYRTYYPDLNAVQCEVLEIPALERPSKKRKSTASVKVTKDVEPLSVMQESKKSMYEQFSIDLIEDGKIYIQVAEEDTMICCMNDYNDSGSLRKEVYVYTTWLKQESGDYFHCTCSIYRTLFDIAHSQTLNYSNRNSCMHCTFLKCIVLPNLQIDERATETKTRKFVQEGKQCAGKDLIELSDFNGTRKFSVLAEGETKPVFLSLSHNKAKANYTVTCHNGECQSKKGHKRYLNNLNSSNLCRHLFVLKHNPESWIDLHERNATNETFLDDQLLDDETNDDAGDGDPVDTNDNFDPETGLWKYKCESSHPAAARESDMLRRNIIKRDGWNDLTLSRQADGSLKGPNFYPDMPDNTCCCGSGWLKRDDDPDYSENGKLIPLGRVLTVYTQFAPVQCDVYKRVCYNPIDDSRCELAWNEGQSESIHVFSSKTAAGDEIGWEFTSSVMKTGCTFSAYCQMKDELYRTRDPKAKFMDATVFLKWWFSWAANMNIDFRQPCDICRYEPNRLCCDGTRVGVGFRHSNFTEISKPDSSLQTQQTLHRRMDRCYLKNKPGVEKRQMIAYREALDNIARTTVAEFEPLDIPENNDRINLLMQALPEEAHQSFQRFTRGMSEFERVAYASVLKMLATTASVTSILSPEYALFLQEFLTNENLSDFEFNRQMYEMRSFAPEIRDLIAESMLNNNNILPDDIKLFLVHLTNESLNLPVYAPEDATFQFGTYNPEKLGRAYYFNEHGVKLRNVRKFQIDEDRAGRNNDHDDEAMDFERCRKIYSKIQQSAPGTSNLFLWFCPDHGHCYGFHMTVAEGRKDPSASLYSHLAKPPQAVFYDFACNLQEYCLNRESGYYKNVRFFHDIFHGYSHKCSTSFRSSRLQGFESVNSEICEQFNSFIQILKKSARQMTQSHFCFYLQFFIHEWNRRKRVAYKRKISTALAGLL